MKSFCSNCFHYEVEYEEYGKYFRCSHCGQIWFVKID